MQINQEQHKKIMLNILADISADPELSVNLSFKGGTCCYFIYGLDRFSVDLDFDLLDINKKDQAAEKIENILSRYGQVKRQDGQLSYKLKYSDQSSALKVDISDRIDLNKLNQYEVLDVVSGVPINILKKEDMFAHKLITIRDRFENKKINKAVANRDLYDIYFFFAQGWDFNKQIIELRSGVMAKKYLEELKKFIEKNVDQKNILNGIGALVDDKKRQWVKNNLKIEVIKQLAIQIKAME